MPQRKPVPADVLNLGCGVDQDPNWHNVDAEEWVNPDEIVDLNTMPWPWQDNCVTAIHASHVFEHLNNMELALRQCERLLQDGGRLFLTLPVGINADADPGHVWGKSGRPWTWRTPEFYNGKRHWDTDVGLEVVRKEVELHSHYAFLPFRVLQHVKWKIEQWWSGGGEWAFEQPAASAEFTVVFENA